MQKFKTWAMTRVGAFFGGAAVAVLIAWPFTGAAQDKAENPKALDPHADRKEKQLAGDESLVGQLAELRVKVARLETALAKGQAGKPSGMAGSGMGMKEDDKMMGGMGGKKKRMGGKAGMEDMDSDEMGGVMEDTDMMGMMGMVPKTRTDMKSMGKMQNKAALPGFPGASRIYHIGAGDFFLNHPDHISLTPKQKIDLGRLKEKAVLAKTSSLRKIDEAEQELWNSTGADEPDAAKIEAKIQEIEKLRADQRMAFIRAVGNAAKLLTEEQRQGMLGTMPEPTAKPDPKAEPKP